MFEWNKLNLILDTYSDHIYHSTSYYLQRYAQTPIVIINIILQYLGTGTLYYYEHIVAENNIQLTLEEEQDWIYYNSPICIFINEFFEGIIYIAEEGELTYLFDIYYFPENNINLK